MGIVAGDCPLGQQWCDDCEYHTDIVWGESWLGHGCRYVAPAEPVEEEETDDDES